MTTTIQTNISNIFLSDDGDKSLNINQDGLIFKSYLLTNNPIETIISPLAITDTNTGNSITIERLTYLPIGLAALEAPPNLKTLHIQDALLVDKKDDINSTTINYDSIVLTDGTTTNTINGTGYTTKNTLANETHYLNFSDNLESGISSIYKTSKLSCNPSTGTITATTFAGLATSSNNVLLTSDNTNGTYFIPFTKTSGTGNKQLFIDDTPATLTYNPSTSTLTANAFNISGTPTTSSQASKLGQIGLVKLQTQTGTICGCVSTIDINLTSCFNTSYKNYKIIISLNQSQVVNTSYPSYALKAFLGTGTLPTVASLYGFEITSKNSTTVSPVYSAGVIIATNPLIFDVSSIPNKQIIFDIKNVGFLNTHSTQVSLYCKSEYNNTEVQGSSDRTITTTSVSGSTITGITLQQTSIGIGNNMNWSASIYGYNIL
jgi:hypothetical protein